ncbi:MAG: aminopeptidase P family protein [Acidobacteriota bacterium]|nr:aminopeptidase P family protein [Acidobacteriota bacterium]
MFSADIYVARRNRLKERIKSGLLLFLGNDESPMNYADNTYHFRQDSTFLYYFGLDFAGLAAVIDLDDGTETIFGTELTVEDIVWMGTQPTLIEKSRLVGVQKTAPAARLAEMLSVAKKSGRTVHFLPPYRPENKLKLLDLLGIPPAQAAQSASVEFIRAVVDQRNIKSAEEIAEIDRASDVSVDMHVAAMTAARPGMKEYELVAEVQRVAQAAGCGLAFPIILTVNGQTLHNHYHGNTLKNGDLVLCDFGAETARHYAADLSSTFPVDPVYSPRQREICGLSLDAYNAAVAMLKPGVPFRDVHLTACRVIARGLKDLGLMKGDVDEAVAQGAHAMFFPCGTGHMMGLDVHDMEDLGEVYVGYDGEPKSTQFGLKSLRLARPLEPGFVLTVEPGIYFIPELMDKWRSEGKFMDFLNYDKMNAYRGFSGVRNEESFLITPEGCRRMGKDKPKSIEDVEALRR